jgi:hypothetical protein
MVASVVGCRGGVAIRFGNGGGEKGFANFVEISDFATQQT